MTPEREAQLKAALRVVMPFLNYFLMMSTIESRVRGAVEVLEVWLLEE